MMLDECSVDAGIESETLFTPGPLIRIKIWIRYNEGLTNLGSNPD